MSYYRPIDPVEVIEVIKNSQFIANTNIVFCREEALNFVQQIKQQHKSANHSCHCFVAGLPEESSQWGYSDDGEPKGTAGLPMFNVLNHSGLGNSCVVVTRYFGGIKLGTGGIARAYSKLVKLALEQSETQLIEITQQINLKVAFSLTGIIEQLIKSSKEITVINRSWLNEGQAFTLEIEENYIPAFKLAISPYSQDIVFID